MSTTVKLSAYLVTRQPFSICALVLVGWHIAHRLLASYLQQYDTFQEPPYLFKLVYLLSALATLVCTRTKRTGSFPLTILAKHHQKSHFVYGMYAVSVCENYGVALCPWSLRYFLSYLIFSRFSLPFVALDRWSVSPTTLASIKKKSPRPKPNDPLATLLRCYFISFFWSVLLPGYGYAFQVVYFLLWILLFFSLCPILFSLFLSLSHSIPIIRSGRLEKCNLYQSSLDPECVTVPFAGLSLI